MLLYTTQSLFPWDALEDSPTIATVKKVLAAIPDQPLLDSLRAHRGHGRDDCPIPVLWGVVLLTVLLRHGSIDACLAELCRNDDLRVLIGLPRDDENKVPKPWNMSRFLEVLGQPPHLQHLRGIFDHLVQHLGGVVPDLGEHTAGDASALNARRTRATPTPTADAAPAGSAAPAATTSAPVGGSETTAAAATPATRSVPAATAGVAPPTAARKPAAQVGTGRTRLPLVSDPTAEPGNGRAATPSADNTTPKDNEKDKEKDKIVYDAHGLPLPAGGRKEYKDDEGRVTKVYQWFGYKMHLLVDVKHEVTLAYQISSPKVGDNEMVPALVQQAKANLPDGRLRTLAYDKAADDEEVHNFLYEEGIEPLIHNRALWHAEPERLLPGHDGTSNIVYDEAGTVYCYDKVSEPPVRRPMSYIGHEPSRGTLKYRCPAKHEGWTCPMSEICNAGKSYGKTVRIKQEEDLRRFPSIPRNTKKFERLYKGRTATERVNARMKIYWGADDGNLVGAPRFHGFLGAVLVVHVALATVLASLPRREGTLGKMKLSPIAAALQEQLAAG